MMKELVCEIEKQYGEKFWRLFCHVQKARTKEDLYAGLKGIAKIIDNCQSTLDKRDTMLYNDDN